MYNCHIICAWNIQEKFGKLVLSFYHKGTSDQNQIMGHTDKANLPTVLGHFNNHI